MPSNSQTQFDPRVRLNVTSDFTGVTVEMPNGSERTLVTADKNAQGGIDLSCIDAKFSTPLVIRSVPMTAGGALSVTGNTNVQYAELCDFTGLLDAGDTVEVRATFSYTGSTNNKTFGLQFGTAAPGQVLGFSVRNSATEQMTEVLFRFSAASQTSLTRQITVFVNAGNAAFPAALTVPDLNGKLFAYLQLASAAEFITLHGYTVTLLKAK